MDYEQLLENIAENINDINFGNILKIRKYIKIKDTDDGFELSQFLIDFSHVCMHLSCEEKSKVYAKMILATIQALNDLNESGANKAMIFDMWLFDIGRISDEQ